MKSTHCFRRSNEIQFDRLTDDSIDKVFPMDLCENIRLIDNTMLDKCDRSEKENLNEKNRGEKRKCCFQTDANRMKINRLKIICEKCSLNA